MTDYANGLGSWVEHKGFRIEVYHDGTWVVYSIDGRGLSMASADGVAAKDIEGAKAEARKAYEMLNQHQEKE